MRVLQHNSGGRGQQGGEGATRWQQLPTAVAALVVLCGQCVSGWRALLPVVLLLLLPHLAHALLDCAKAQCLALMV